MDSASNLKWLLLALTVVFLPLLAGCATLPNGRGWGQDATLCPGWDRVGQAALNAALSPGTWAPAAGAAVFQIGHLDRNLSRWASNNTPIFGSKNNADTASDVLEATSEAAYVITTLATPSGADSGEWAKAKAKGLLVGLAAIGLTEGATDGLKYSTRVTRPDRSGHDSFPSGHASRTAVCYTLASRNLTFLDMPPAARAGLRLGFLTLTAGTAWSRLEAKKHYPSDVLAGMALGHFLGAFINDAFLGADAQSMQLTVAPSRKETMVSLNWLF